MVRVARKMVGDRDVVYDIVQEIFIDLFDKLNNGYVVNHPKSWLCKATANRCVDSLRKQKRFENIESLGEYKAEQELTDNQELSHAVSLAILKLKPQERILVTLYSEGLSYKEIADATGTKFSSIGKMLSRALKKIETELKNKKHELY